MANVYAYNTGTTISGTDQIGDIAIGPEGQEYSTNIGGVQWWGEPDTTLGYIICGPVPSGTQPNPLLIPGYIQFWRSKLLTEGSFVDLSNYIATRYSTPQNFTGGTEAKSWLNTNGYYTSYDSAISFTIDPSRVSFEGGFGANFTSTSVNGYGIDNNYNNQLWPAYYFTISDDDTDIISSFTSAGIPTNGQGYIFNVIWGPGSTSSSLVKVSYNNGGKQMNMIAVDPSDTNWQINNNISGTALLGTFNFPATFTPYYPITDKNSWC